ncbi:MAG: hypothetical protein ACFHX7_19850 [Pseudomonadota bacterium]
MSKSILSLGLSPEMLSSLSSRYPAEFCQAADMSEAFRLLGETDFSSIILDSSSFQRVDTAIAELLGQTPFTTLILLLCGEGDEFNHHKLARMGIRTIKPPLEVATIVQHLPG